MKTCTKCQECKPDSDFHVKSKAKQLLYSQCKSCHRQYTQDHYAKNKAYYLKKAKKAKAKWSRELQVLKENPCADCEKTYPYYVMDFDHKDGSNKLGNVCDFTRVGQRRKALAEIAKCDLVCANCHRIRTFNRIQGQVV